MIHHRIANKIIMVLIVLGILFCIGGIFTGWITEEDKLADNPKIEYQIIEALNEIENVEVIVMLKESEGREIQSDILMENPEFKVKYQYSIINAFAGEADKETLENLADNPQVEKIYLNKKLQIHLDESAPLINADDVNKAKLNNINLTGKYQSICVIDTGVNYNHPALAGRVILGWDYVNNDSDPMDDNSHGTHVAGIIASNDSTYRGVAPEANIVAIKACNSGGGCDGDAVLAGIDWCINNASLYNISVISMSLGDNGEYSEDNCPTDFDDEINSAIANNIIIVVSSGNIDLSNGISFPSCSPNATSVGASDKNDNVWDDSNTGENLDLLAPGVNIQSTVLGSNFGGKDGTSMAAPHVSGTAALMYQNYKLKNQSITPKQIEDKLKTTGKSITDPENELSFPRINAEEAVLSARLEADYIASPYPIKNRNITLYGNYTNRTNNNSVSGGNCLIRVNGSIYNTTYNNEVYQHIHNFTTPAIYDFEVQCNDSNFESLITQGVIEVVNGSENCTYPGSNIDWNLTGSAYSSCVVENLTINKSNINIKDNSKFILNHTNLTLVDASINYIINVSSEANFTSVNSTIKSNVGGYDLNLEIHGYGNIYNTTFENSQLSIYGNKTHEIITSTLKDYIYLKENSTSQIINSTSTSRFYSLDNSISSIENSIFSGDRFDIRNNIKIGIENSSIIGVVYLQDNSVINFTGEISNLTNEIRTYDSPKIYGEVDMPPTGSVSSGNVTRYYPVYIYYHGTTTPYPNKQVNITDSNGNLVWQGTTNSQGYVEPDLLLNTTNYRSGNFTISVNESKDINLLTDTPITLESSTSPPDGGSPGGGDSVTNCDEDWSCGNWSDICINGLQERTCVDANDCGTSEDKPNETQICSFIELGSGRGSGNLEILEEDSNPSEPSKKVNKSCCLFGICWFRYFICWYWWILISTIFIFALISRQEIKRRKRKKIESTIAHAVGADWVVKKFHLQ
ncbi:MAG TPA: S8 family serine peptidase [Candidatus Nanoarchaeia archaeon]|nr:S8 family serine peptidase [Candidatus Nanoarchaeia archaeon]